MQSALVTVNTDSPKQCLGAEGSLRSRSTPDCACSGPRGASPGAPSQAQGAVVFPCAATVSEPLWGVLTADRHCWLSCSWQWGLPPQQSDIQSCRKEGNHLFTKYINLQTLDTELPFSWEQGLGCVPWSPDIHPTLGRRGRSITTPWQCLCDPLRAAPVLNALLQSFSTDCGQEKFVRRAPSSPWGEREDNEGS